MKSTSPANYYEDYWKNRHEWLPDPTWSAFQQKLFKQFITPEVKVLDVGCGNGESYGRFLAPMVKEYHGLDISHAALEVAQGFGIKTHQQDLETPFPFPDQTFDRILCIEVFEHLFAPAFTLSEIRRVLKPNGALLLSVPNCAHISNRLRMVLGGFSPGGSPETSSRRPWADAHIRFFTLRTLRWFVEEQNLEVVQVYGNGFSIFNTLPVVSSLMARVTGWQRLEKWSEPFEFLAQWWPSMCAGHLFVLTRPRA